MSNEHSFNGESREEPQARTDRPEELESEARRETKVCPACKEGDVKLLAKTCRHCGFDFTLSGKAKRIGGVVAVATAVFAVLAFLLTSLARYQEFVGLTGQLDLVKRQYSAESLRVAATSLRDSLDWRESRLLEIERELTLLQEENAALTQTANAAPAREANPRINRVVETWPRNSVGRQWNRRPISLIECLVIHQELGHGTGEAVARYVTGPTSHLSRGGTESINTHFFIEKSGEINQGNDLDVVVWHAGYKDRVGDENVECVAINLAGVFRGPGVTDPSATAGPNESQMESLRWLVDYLLADLSLGPQSVHGHSEFGKPACPGTMLDDWIREQYGGPV